jgi:hypothetical protein
VYFVYDDMGNVRGDRAFVLALAAALQIVFDRRIEGMRIGFVGGPATLRGLKAEVMSYEARRWPGTERFGGGACIASVSAGAFRFHLGTFTRAAAGEEAEDFLLSADVFLFTPTRPRHGALYVSSVGHERLAWCHASAGWSSHLHSLGFSVERDANQEPAEEELVA